MALDEKGAVSLESTKEDILAVKEMAQKAGIELYSVASGLYWTYNYTSENEENRKGRNDCRGQGGKWSNGT